MKVIELNHHEIKDKGFSSVAILLDSLPGFEKYESYVVLPNGHLCSGKGGKFKRLQPQKKHYMISYQRPFMKFYQMALHTEDLRAIVKQHKDVATMVRIEVE